MSEVGREAAAVCKAGIPVAGRPIAYCVTDSETAGRMYSLGYVRRQQKRSVSVIHSVVIYTHGEQERRPAGRT